MRSRHDAVLPGLADVDIEAPSLAPLAHAFYDEDKARAAAPPSMSGSHATRCACARTPRTLRRARAHECRNPRFVLRNYLAQQAIDRAEQGDPTGVQELLDVMRHPYEEQPGREVYRAETPGLGARTGRVCSMLSCSLLMRMPLQRIPLARHAAPRSGRAARVEWRPCP
jgi:uncharacterized protein YdiU (UPF0061 family)